MLKQGWSENQLDVSDYSASYKDVSGCGRPLTESPRRSNGGGMHFILCSIYNHCKQHNNWVDEANVEPLCRIWSDVLHVEACITQHYDHIKLWKLSLCISYLQLHVFSSLSISDPWNVSNPCNVEIYCTSLFSGGAPESPQGMMTGSFKTFSPQPPKFFKPLMPVKEEHHRKTPIETQPLLGLEVHLQKTYYTCYSFSCPLTGN